jgi:hypothetical protein
MGKTIKIYLPNESVSGIRHAEIANWSGQALACPRSRFQELRDWPELHRPGVYFLFGADDQTGEDAVYIGEAEIVIDRLSAHIAGKDFWAEAVAFTSKDENLTKAHVRYLESRLISMSKLAGRHRILNSASPQLPSLPRSDRDAMDEFLESAKMLLGALGHRVLDPFVVPLRATPPFAQPDGVLLSVSKLLEDGPLEKVVESSPTFHLRVAGIHGRSVQTDEGMVVLEGSEATVTTFSSMSGRMEAIRKMLIETGTLAPFGKTLRFTRDHLFKSPSQAGGVLAGYSINGREYWKLDDGTSYASYETRQSNSMLNELTDG